jgi:hypothetical protein
VLSGRDDFNREYNYNSGSFSVNDKNEIHVNQDSPEDGEEDDDEYDSNDEEVILCQLNLRIDNQINKELY